MNNYAQKFDGKVAALALTVLALSLIGLVAVYSATVMEAVQAGHIVSASLSHQALIAAGGAAIGCAIYRLAPADAWSGRVAWALWALAIVLLVATELFGTVALGAKRRLDIGPVELQPSEFMKVAFVVMAAKTVGEAHAGELTRRGMWAMLGLRVGAPVVALLYFQSDLGTAMVCIVGVMVALWLYGVPGRDMLALCVGCLALGTVAVVTSPYRLERFLVTYDPWNDGQGGLGSGYQLIHSLYALATGGVFGTGIGSSSEKYGALPEVETDFIFALIGEETGLVGATAVIALFLVLLWAGMRISREAGSPFASSLSGALVAMLVFQAFLNIASVIGAFPMTGKPLPFISYGGSSLVMSFVMAGMIASAARTGPSERQARRRRDGLRVVRASSPQPARGASKRYISQPQPPRYSAPRSGDPSLRPGEGGRGRRWRG